MKRIPTAPSLRWTVSLVVLAATATPARAEIVERTVGIEMKDGVRLEAALVLPPDAVKVSTVLVRTPYNRVQQLEEARFWAENGYAVLIQDVRGKFGSEGEYVPFLNEHADGSETLDWIVGQPWSDGKVAMWGSSYLAFCQLVLASSRHPALRSILPISGFLHDDGVIQQGGAHHIMLSIPWILLEESQTQRPIGDVDLDEMFEFLPLLDVFESIGLESRIWNEEYDFSPLDAFSGGEIRIPALHITGWNDFAYEAALAIYQQIVDGPAAPLQRLMVGPWSHDQFWTTYTETGDEDFGPDSALGRERLRQLSLDWFDATLGADTSALTHWPPARVFLMGPNEWRDYPVWPPREMERRKLYLGAGEGANSLAGDGHLAPVAADALGFDRFTFDPMNPVPTHGGANFHLLAHLVGVKDQRRIEKRDDVLVYTTPPLADELEIAGPIQVVLYASTDGPDTDFTAKLVEVRASGYARIIEEGILRASHRNGPDTPSPTEPGEIYRLTIELGSTAIRIPAGHRVRLEISSSNFPKYDRNPNTGEDPLKARRLRTAAQKVYRGGELASHLVLPVVPK